MIRTCHQVSVCIPVYNAARYLSDCVESVQAQTYPPSEIILMDDASTDRSLEVAWRLAKRDSRIQIHSKEHTALGDTRNRMIRHSSSALVAFLDADDMAEPDRLAKQVAFLDAHPRSVGVGGHVHFIDLFGNHFYYQPKLFLDPVQLEMQLLKGQGSALWQSTVMLRRNAFEKVGGYNPALNCFEDLDLYLRLVEIGELWNLPDVLVTMRRYPQSISSVGKHEDAERVRASVLMPVWKRRGITELPLFVMGISASSRAVWQTRTALGYLDANSPRIALIHWFCGLMENPMSVDVWRAFGQIVRRIVKGGWVGKTIGGND